MANVFYATAWALLPPLVAIMLTLITKEVYSSLFIGIVCGALMNTNFSVGKTIVHIFKEGFLVSITDMSNMSVIVFVIILGAIVKLLEWSGGAMAFGHWVALRIKTKIGAQLATMLLGVLFFIDDGFSCLSVSNIMRPVCDEKGISREKLAYIVDSTAAPVCILMPISSWGAAVSAYVSDGNGLYWFIRTIPYNFYAICTLIFVIVIIVSNKDFGPMAKAREVISKETQDHYGTKASYLVIPFIVLITACIIGMLYTGGLFEGASFYTAVSESNAPLGFVYGSSIALIFTIVFYSVNKVLTYKRCIEALPEGAKMMMPVILILIFAWTLKIEISQLGTGYFVSNVVKTLGPGFMHFIPAIVFAFSAFLAFSSGTSWGTFGILIPIVIEMVPLTEELGVISLAACLAGSVFGDHCSPISDTTIMSSAGSGCNHLSHVSTQVPYALVVAAISLVLYIIVGFCV
ncbi:MAG: Na+/H+ antiporter NhaC family protein [Clostridia bacterium]|nr:Na+/H+ antiporter NhaC family protein [Clostridia bacterium]